MESLQNAIKKDDTTLAIPSTQVFTEYTRSFVEDKIGLITENLSHWKKILDKMDELGIN